MQQFSPDWPRALTLLDEVLALRPEARADWLESTAAREPSVSPLLRKLLSAHRRVETHAILATLPRSLRNKTSTDTGQTGLLIGPFELIESLGRGGMGSVWRARYADGRLKRDVAVKLPAASDDPAALAALCERFARERDFLGQLEHPNIARLYDTGVSDDGQPFLAMEYVIGQPIDEYCDAHRLPIKARLALFLQVLDAVEYAHRQLVLHRDLKPANVLVDEQGQVRLLDFGVAKLLPPTTPALTAATAAQVAQDSPVSTGTDLTEMAGAAITLAYAAPEQISHLPLSTATDVYALGVMLYRLLTGLSPYQPSRDTRGSLEDAVVTTTPEAASTRHFASDALAARQVTTPALRKTLRDDIDIILAKALKKNANERYPTVNAFADDLRRHQAQQPIAARPDSAWYRSTRFVARHKVATLASTLGVLTLLGTTGVALWQARIAIEQGARASKEATRANAAQKFFAGLFANADPERNKNITPMDRQVIDRALATAERDFAAAPETLAHILKQLGEIYFRLGVAEKYLEVQKKRVTVLESMPVANVDDFVEAQVSLGQALGDSDVAADRAQALPTLLRAQAVALEKHASDEVVVRTLCLVADQHKNDGKFQAAYLSAAEAVKHAERTLLNPHPMLSFAYEAHGVTAAKLADFDVARSSFQKSIAIDSTGRGRGGVDQLNTRIGLAQLEYDAAQYLVSKREALAAIEFAEKNLGKSGSTLTPVRLIAILASDRAGDVVGAKRLARELLADDLASGTAFRVGRAQYVKGIVALSESDLEGAKTAFSAAETGLLPNVAWAPRLLTHQGALQLSLGDATAAYALLDRARNLIRTRVGTDTSDFSRASERTGVALVRLNRHPEARTTFEEACLWRSKVFAANHPDRVRCESYRILASDQSSVAKKRLAIEQQLSLLLVGRDDQMALVSSLRDAILRLTNTTTLSDPTQFPILN